MEGDNHPVKPIDPYYKIDKKDYDKKYLFESGVPNSTIIFGMTKSGKSTICCNLLCKKLLHEYDPDKIIFFSKTIDTDLTYKPVFCCLADMDQRIRIYDTIDFDILQKIVDKLKAVKKRLMIAETKADEPKLDKYLIIFDDVLGDKNISSRGASKLSDFSTRARHYNISFIILTLDWTCINHTIRRQTPMVFLCATDNYSDIMIKENALKGEEKQFSELYKETNLKKDYSILQIDKSKKKSDRIKLLDHSGIHPVEL